MNPYDNNPFKTDEKELKNEQDANRELAKTANENRKMVDTIFRPMQKDKLGFWK